MQLLPCKARRMRLKPSSALNLTPQQPLLCWVMPQVLLWRHHLPCLSCLAPRVLRVTLRPPLKPWQPQLRKHCPRLPRPPLPRVLQYPQPQPSLWQLLQVLSRRHGYPRFQLQWNSSQWQRYPRLPLWRSWQRYPRSQLRQSWQLLSKHRSRPRLLRQLQQLLCQRQRHRRLLPK